MDFRTRISNMILAGYQSFYVATVEEDRCEAELEAVGEQVVGEVKAAGGNMATMPLITWDGVAGFSWMPGKAKNIQDPIEAILSLQSQVQKDGSVRGAWGDSSAIFVFRDFHVYLKDPGVSRAFRNLAEKNKLNSPPHYRRPVVVLSPIVQMPDGIKHIMTLVRFDPPTAERLADIFDSIRKGLKSNDQTKATCTSDLRDRIVQSMLGLREREAEDTLAYALRIHKGICEELVDTIEDQKALTLEKSEVLRYIPKDKIPPADAVAGYEELKGWLEERKLAFTPQARALNIDPPKGVLLLGVPGTFKTGVGKIIASILRFPLIFFNVARIGASLVGQSQQRMEEALQTVDTIDGSVLLVDDADKLFAGVTGPSGDSGTRLQTFGQFLVWLTERTSRTFVVMTMNRTAGIPAEFLRRGRFDAVFVTSLPDETTIEEILKIHLRKRCAGVENFGTDDMAILTSAMRGFVGAEIEQVIIDARFMALTRSKLQHGNPTVDELVTAAKQLKPMCETQGDVIEEMVRLCETQGRSVDRKREETTDNKRRARNIVLS